MFTDTKTIRDGYVAYENASREYVQVTLDDGRRGSGWTEREAVANACRSFDEGDRMWRKAGAYSF